jgi:diaminopimelate epimerase
MLQRMRIEFTKMHGLGNDFIIFDAPPGAPLPSAAQWRQLADRHTGIGFDQALVLEAPRAADAAIYYRIFNADGGEVEQCGNGARCVARLLHQRQAGNAELLTMDSTGGRLQARILPNGMVSVDMGVPDFNPASLPFLASAPALSYELSLEGENVRFGAVSMGNPHAVIHVQDIESAPVERLGRALQASASFPRQVNVGFMQVLDAAHLRLRVYERGVGETLACGTGTCAAVAVARSLGLVGPEVEVHVRGGRLGVHWSGPGHALWLTGPAETAFVGQVEI